MGLHRLFYPMPSDVDEKRASTPPAPDETKAGFHEVIRPGAPENAQSWLPSPHEANNWSFVGSPRLPAVDGTRLGRISAPL